MTLRNLGWTLIALAALIGLGSWLASDYIVLHAPGIVGELLDPIGPPRDVTWETGPAAASTPPAERSPNIIVILVDDLGYNDLTWRGGGIADGAVPTPNIDSLARDGVEFTAGYAGNATCAPSRAAIMTGRYPTRFGFEFTPAPKLFMRLVASFNANRLHPPIYFEEREDDVPPMDLQGVPPEEAVTQGR